MMRTPHAQLATRLGFLVWLVSWLPHTARAGNDDEFFVGSRAAMIGGAVAATVDDSSATWYNPAGLAAADRQQVDFTGTAYTLRLYSAPRMLATAAGVSRDGHITEFLAVPTQAAYVRRLGPRTSLGFGYFAPQARNLTLKTNLKDSYGNPPSEWQLFIAESATQQVFAAGLGYSLAPQLRLGVSLLGGYGTASGSQAQFGAAFSDGRTQGSSSGALLFSQWTISAQLGFGVQFDLTPQLAIGVNLRSPELQIYTSTDIYYNTTQALPANAESPLQATSGEQVESTNFELLRSGRAGLSLAYRYASGFVSAEVDVQPGLRRPTVHVNRTAVVNARAGWYNKLTPLIAMGIGVFTDLSSDRDEDAFSAGRENFYGATFGLELSNARLLAPNERATSLIFTSVFALRYAFGFGDFRGLVGNPDKVGTDEIFTTRAGSIYIHELSVYVAGGLHF